MGKVNSQRVWVRLVDNNLFTEHFQHLCYNIDWIQKIPVEISGILILKQYSKETCFCS